MRKIIYLILVVGVLFLPNACVDDYTDSNPPHLLDAPTLRISDAVGTDHIFSTVAVNQYQNGYTDMTTYDAPVVYTVSVIDAPGKIGDITVTPSIPEFGSVTIDDASVTALQGKETGTFNFTFTPNATFVDRPDAALNLVIAVSDMQKDDKGEASSLTTTLTVPVTLVKCLTNTDIVGVYEVTTASGNLDGGETYNLDSLQKYNEDNVYVEISKVRPGEFTIDEVTGGVWPIFYDRVNPALDFDLCGTSINGHFGSVTTKDADTGEELKFTIDGIVNEDGTIDISWSYVRLDDDTATDPATGTYTLTKAE
jgi:hypothetical protein